MKYSIAAVLFLVGCGPSAEDVDALQVTSKENATKNLMNFMKTEFDGVEDWSIQSDSTVGPKCPSGDGWASAKVVTLDKQEHKVKCQTTGSGRGISGCLMEAVFNQKDYVNQDGKCDKSLKLKAFK